jgi:site-specific DNA-methyltransferase (adenine-specific)
MKTIEDAKKEGVRVNEIYCCDCLELMKLMPDKSVDLVLTDPPYGIKRFNARDGGNSKKIKSFGHTDENWNRIKPTNECFNEIFRVSKNQIIFGMNNFSLPPTEYFIVWDKGQKLPSFAECELIWTSIKKPAKIIRVGFQRNKVHPAQKPVELIIKILENYAKTSAIIFDPFLGSGTTAVAAKMLGKNYIGCEISEKYCKIAEERIKLVSSSILTGEVQNDK